MADEWITAAEALAIIAKILPRDEAISVILDSAYSGQIGARAELFIPSSNGFEEHREYAVSRNFWANRLAKTLPQNWATGDFVEWFADEGFPHSRAIGVKFYRSDVAECLMSLVAAEARTAEPKVTVSKGGSYVDRALWDRWTVELVVYLHEEGCPAGPKALSIIRNALDDRLAEAGKSGPSRNSVDPIIKDVLDRIGTVSN